MIRSHFKRTSRLILTAIFLSLSPILSAQAEISQKQQDDTYQQLETFANILSILQENYVEDIKTKEAIEGAITGLLLSLDPHSSYLKPESYQEFQNETQGSFTGIGIEITMRDGVITVIAPIEDTPADMAGIKAHDKIVKINGEQTKDKTPLDAVKMLRGPKGSEVTISIYRDGWKELKDIILVRDVIPLHSVKSFQIKPGFAYVRISTFQSHTTKEFKDHLRQMQEKSDIEGLILDLRNNPGGLLNQAVSVADIFLDDGLIVYTRGRIKDQDLSFEANDNESTAHYPLVVLVNEGSASASEIVAGAIQDHRRGVLIGSKTFGKGSVQTIIPLPDGAGLRMTTARYFTPNGRSIQATGITPDVTVAAQSSDDDEEQTNGGKSPVLREEDLGNHFTNQDGNDTSEDDILSENVAKRLRSDNQLRAAFDILKSLVLYASYRDEEFGGTKQ